MAGGAPGPGTGPGLGARAVLIKENHPPLGQGLFVSGSPSPPGGAGSLLGSQQVATFPGVGPLILPGPLSPPTQTLGQQGPTLGPRVRNKGEGGLCGLWWGLSWPGPGHG